MKHKTQTVLIRFGYVGQHFHGLQAQSDLRTVAGDLRARLERLSGQPLSALNFAARTDAGVSAVQNAATFRLPVNDGLERLTKHFSEHNCSALWIDNIHHVPRGVNARNSAESKCYRYRILAADAKSTTEQIWNIVPQLNVSAMRAAATYLIGTHDFSAFRSAGCGAKSTTKTVTVIDIFTIDDGSIVIEYVGSAFLRKMVRIMTGTLAEVGAGLMSVDDVRRARDSGCRGRAGITAPAKGLTLERVFFSTALEAQLGGPSGAELMTPKPGNH